MLERCRLKGPPAQGPRVAVRGSKGCSQGRHYAQANITEIKRIVAALLTRESRVAAAEQKLAEASAQVRKTIADFRVDPKDPKLQARYKTAKSKRDECLVRLVNAKEWRVYTAKRLRLYLDHALVSTPYTAKRCKACTAGTIVDANGAPRICSECNGTRQVRIENTNPFARTAVPILRHLSRVLEDVELCFKIRAGTGDKDAAFQRLLDANQVLVKKFGNPTQTGLEADDAEQGAIWGLYDGAKRFDPTRPTRYVCPRCNIEAKITDADHDEAGRIKSRKCGSCGLQRKMLGTSTATYRTYAWNWSKRNSRARKDTELRPGLLHASLDDPAMCGVKDEEIGSAEKVTVVGGRASMAQNFVADPESGILARDLREQIDSLEDEMQRRVLECMLASMQPSEIAESLNLTSRQVVKYRSAAFEVMRERLTGYVEG